MGYVWDLTVRRYRDSATGRFVRRDMILGYVDRLLRGGSGAVAQLSSLVAGGALAPADFDVALRVEIKNAYIDQYLLARGGRKVMTQADWGRIGGMLKEQYRYLDGFIAAIGRGDLTEGQIRARASMYINSAREAFERARALNAQDVGATLEVWVVNHALENCNDCLRFESMGAKPLGTFPMPGDGSTECLTNCGCHKVYMNVAGKVLA